MQQCSKCEAFVPAKATSCPGCRSKSSWWRTPLTVLGAGFLGVTLSACYGSPCAAGNCPVDNPCNDVLSDGGLRRDDPASAAQCKADAGVSDGGAKQDGGVDGGP